MGPVGDVVLVATLREEVAFRDGRRKAGRVPVFVAVLISRHGVEAVVRTEDMISAGDGLVVVVVAGIRGRNKVLLQAGSIRRRIETQDLLGHRTDAALGNHVSSERISDIGTGAAGLYAAAAGFSSLVADVAAVRIENLNAKLAEMLPVAEIDHRYIADFAERRDLAPALLAIKDEVFVFADRSAGDAAELVLVMRALLGADLVVLRQIGVHDPVAEIFEHVTVPIVGAGLQSGIDHTAREASVLGAVGVGHDFELLHRFDIGRELPCAVLVADGSAVEQELAGARASAIEDR